MSNDTIELQSRIAFLDEDVTGLRETVDAHQRQILSLEHKIDVLTQRLQHAMSEQGDTPASNGDEVPPHY